MQINANLGRTNTNIARRGMMTQASFFQEKFFWTHANIGPVFLVLLFAFPLYRTCKDFYWTQSMRRLNRNEIYQDRYDWLQRSMLQDEVEVACLAKLDLYK